MKRARTSERRVVCSQPPQRHSRVFASWMLCEISHFLLPNDFAQLAKTSIVHCKTGAVFYRRMATFQIPSAHASACWKDIRHGYFASNVHVKEWPPFLQRATLPCLTYLAEQVPSTLTELVCRNSHCLGGQSVSVFTLRLPPSIKRLRMWFGSAEHCPRNHLTVPSTEDIAKGDFPIGLTKLWVGMGYNQRFLSGSLPNNLTDLALFSYTHIIAPGVLPNSLKKLALQAYNHPLEMGTLPPSIIKLNLRRFNHPLHSGLLPPHLQKLELYSYSKAIEEDHTLPVSLTQLHLEMFAWPLYIRFLSSLSKLQVLVLASYDMFDPYTNFLPPSLVELRVRGLAIQICHTPLTKLTILHCREITSYGSVPRLCPSLTHLNVLRYSPANRLASSELCSTLCQLTISNYEGRICRGVLPDSLRMLRLQAPIFAPNALPMNLDVLYLGRPTNGGNCQRIYAHLLPRSVRELHMRHFQLWHVDTRILTSLEYIEASIVDFTCSKGLICVYRNTNGVIWEKEAVFSSAT